MRGATTDPNPRGQMKRELREGQGMLDRMVFLGSSSNCTQNQRIPRYRAMMLLNTKIYSYLLLCKSSASVALAQLTSLDRNGKNELTVLEICVPFPALPSALHVIRDKSPPFHSCKINTEILGLTVLPVSSSDHKLIKNSGQESSNKRIPCCCSKSASMCG